MCVEICVNHAIGDGLLLKPNWLYDKLCARCAINNGTVETTEIHKPSAIIIAVAKAAFFHHMSEQDVIRV